MGIISKIDRELTGRWMKQIGNIIEKY